MSGVGLIFIAIVFLIGVLFVGWVTTFDVRAWITKGLKRGDLHSLIDVASGRRPDGLTRDQARRLQSRGMVRPRRNGYFRATVKGRLALRIRQAMRHREQH